jgi:tRNA(Leu) C34 or U34 (ribose-2'-O)-methylase TrmL
MQISKTARKEGVTPAIALINPKFPHNVSMTLRLASGYGVKQVWFTGKRVTLDPPHAKSKPGKGRLPREERMKGYKKVELRNYDYFFDQFEKDVIPVAVELHPSAESLFTFEHPDKALYVFGPEDGDVTSKWRQHCHKFVFIPTKHCLNLATAVATIFWDRQTKLFREGKINPQPLEFILEEDRGWIDPRVISNEIGIF